MPDGPGVPCSAPPLCPECTMPPLKSGMFKHDVGLGRQMAGSLLFPPQITVWDSFLGLHPGFLLLFHPPAPQSIYLSTHKYLSYQLISINLSLSKLALINFFLSTDLYQTYHDQTYIYELINLCQIYLYQTCLCQPYLRALCGRLALGACLDAAAPSSLCVAGAALGNFQLCCIKLTSCKLASIKLSPSKLPSSNLSLSDLLLSNLLSLSPSQTCLYQI